MEGRSDLPKSTVDLGPSNDLVCENEVCGRKCALLPASAPAGPGPISAFSSALFDSGASNVVKPDLIDPTDVR